MKKIKLKMILGCLALVSFVGCRTSEREWIVEYRYINNTTSDITITRWIDPKEDTQPNKIIILPGEEYLHRNGFPGVFLFPFFENGIYQLAADNGERFVISKRNGEIEITGLFDTANYELVYDRKRERCYRFVFTDDYFKNGEPMENFPTE